MVGTRWLLLCTFLLLASCNQKRDYSFDDQRIKPSQFRVILVPTRPTEQKVAIEVQATGGPVDVYLMPHADKDLANRAAGEAIVTRQAPKEMLAGKQQVTQTKLEVTIPAEKAFCVMLCNPYQREAVVQVKVTGQ